MAKLQFETPTEQEVTGGAPLVPNATSTLVTTEEEFMTFAQESFAKNPDRSFAVVIIPLADDPEIVQNTRKARGEEGTILSSITLGGTHNDKAGSRFKITSQELMATMPRNFPDARLAGQYLEVTAQVLVRTTADEVPATETSVVTQTQTATV